MGHWLFEHDEPDNRARAADREEARREWNERAFKVCMEFHGPPVRISLEDFFTAMAERLKQAEEK